MRYYDTTYRDDLKNYIYAVKREIRDIDYDKPINETDVDQAHNYLKEYCLAAANEAHDQVDILRERTKNAGNLVDKFYKDVANTGSSIQFTATNIGDLLLEANNSMIRIHNALNGIGEYKGRKVNSGIINKVGVDKAKCDKISKDVWEKITDLQVKKHVISDYVAIRYVENINATLRDGKKLSSKEKDWFDDICEHYLKMYEGKNIMLSQRERELISTIHSQYVELRFGPLDDCRDLPKVAINNCIVAYEMLNPDAKKVTDGFFDKVLKENNEEIDFSVDCIKYVLYTDDPKYRDVILYYLPMAQLERIEPGDIASCSGNTIKLVLTEDHDNRLENDGAFTHEIGHFIDDYAYDDVKDKKGKTYYNYSDYFRKVLKDDLRNHMIDAFVDLGYGDMKDGERDAVLDFIFSSENVNIAYDKDKTVYQDYLPEDWSPKQIEAFTAIRSHYGYCDYVYDPSSFDVYDTDSHPGLANDTDERGLINDIIGGETNNQVGGMGGHTLNSKKEVDGKAINSSIIKSEEDLHNALKEYDYWYSEDGKLNNHYVHEFFAESFELRVYGIDQKPTRDIFTNASNRFDEAYDEIYARVQAATK